MDGSDLITLEVKRPRTIPQEDTIPSYTERDGTVLEVPAEMSGRMGLWPYSRAFSYTLGDHPKADELRELGLSERAFARVAAAVDITIESGRPV